MFGFATTSGADTLLLSLVAPESGWHSSSLSLGLLCICTQDLFVFEISVCLLRGDSV